jgi:hypothetical protein
MAADEITPEIRAKLEAMTLADAALVHDITVGGMASTINIIGKAAPDGAFTDEQLYGLVRKSLPRMLDKPGGIETLLAVASVAIMRQIKTETEPS